MSVEWLALLAATVIVYAALKVYVRWRLQNMLLGTTALWLILTLVNTVEYGLPLAVALWCSFLEALGCATTAGLIYAFLLKPLLRKAKRRS